MMQDNGGTSSDHAKLTGSQVPAKIPRVSIIIPNFNAAPYIAETLDAVFGQTYSDHEVIVINDGSPDTDLLKEVLVPYREKIIFIDYAQNRGAASARNAGIQAARGELVAFVDADDIWLPQYLQSQLDFLGRGNFDMVYTDCTLFGQTSAPGFDMRSNNPAEGEITRKLLIDGKCHILPSGTVIKKVCLTDAGMFDETVPTAEDFDLFMRLIFAGVKIGYQRKCLFRYRVWPASESADMLHRFNRNIFIWRLLQDRLPFTEEETAAIEKHIKAEEASILRTKGKIEIINKNWQEAAGYFSQAKDAAQELGFSFQHKARLSGVLLMLKFAPELLRKMMLKGRPEEAAFMPDKI